MRLGFNGKGAYFSACEVYRYLLWRVWEPSAPKLMWLMLNPSTADSFKNDPTVERCSRRAAIMGYGSMVVCNIFALRSTNPAVLYQHNDPVGRGNDEAIFEASNWADQIILGWGGHGAYLNRGAEVMGLLERHISRGAVKCLEWNQDGHPKHPLYIGYDVQPKVVPPALLQYMERGGFSNEVLGEFHAKHCRSGVPERAAG